MPDEVDKPNKTKAAFTMKISKTRSHFTKMSLAHRKTWMRMARFTAGGWAQPG